MASNRRRLQWNTRERLLSTDLNDATALIHANISDDIAAILSGDLYKSALPLSGVVAGGVASADGISLDITITPIVAFKNGTPASGFDSEYLRIETLSSVTVDLTAYVDGAAARWVAIEVAPGTAAEVVSARDIFQPPIGTFTPANVDKVIKSEPVFTVNAGVPAASPVIPNGNPDVIPLCYVYIPAAAAAIGVNDVIRCRPIFNASNNETTLVHNVGGVSVPATGTTIAQLRPFGVKFSGQGVQMYIPAGFGSDADIASHPNWVSGESYPAGEAPIYAYLAYPPFPSGYDNDVANNREFIDPSGRIPSNPVYVSNNGIIVWSTTAPSQLGDIVGARPGGAFALNDATWGGGTTAFHAYLGAASAQTVAPAGLCKQFTSAGGLVRFQEDDKMPHDAVTVRNVAETLPPVSAGQFRNRAPLLLGNVNTAGVVFPAAKDWDVVVGVDDSPGGGQVGATLAGDSDPLDVFGRGPFYHRTFSTTLNLRKQEQYRFRTGETGGTRGAFVFDASEAADANNFVFRVIVLGYWDDILSNR